MTANLWKIILSSVMKGPWLLWLQESNVAFYHKRKFYFIIDLLWYYVLRIHRKKIFDVKNDLDRENPTFTIYSKVGRPWIQGHWFYISILWNFSWSRFFNQGRPCLLFTLSRTTLYILPGTHFILSGNPLFEFYFFLYLLGYYVFLIHQSKFFYIFSEKWPF